MRDVSSNPDQLPGIRRYLRSESVVFRKTREEWGGLSNMASGFPVWVSGIQFPSSEALYQACRYPHIIDAQKEIIAAHSAMAAKMKSKKYYKYTLEPWDALRVPIMKWALRVKYAYHPTTFGRILLATGEKPIVEEGYKDPFWSAQPQDDGTLLGYNVLGRLLMELREQIQEKPSNLEWIAPPDIKHLRLLGKTAEEFKAPAAHGKFALG